ncbi:unnamed protein product (macronuclear) [Paramecium tetraurelia]|uniref:Uncharacterized protein n=1 Tax=Paramecium tetraurelia TaxID=5888 RepID=A0BF83_PARTE|nr:uncharacterized protein GSPATT00028235001 [Paramecium tetraurelia]CAK57200.1 unnamed protein product [Paramecium tetraurelia]|eukprot:XP_001424598.1 hypothetical protein (macronuclear) [Paramecium tetraurelia strain d4-2]
MQRKQQFESDFNNFQEASKTSLDQMFKLQDLNEKNKETCLRNAKTFELFATCMERHEGKIDNIAKYLSMKMLFIEKQALECYKGNTNDREFERCHQRVEQQLHDVYSEYYQGLLNL